MAGRHSREISQDWRITAIAFGFAIAALRCGPAPAEQVATLNTIPLFGTTEIASHDLTMFPKWRHTLQAFAEEVKSCRPGRCGTNEWWAAVEGMRGKDLMSQLRETNIRLNRKRYIADDANWDLPDYWTTPFEFLSKAGGDCEDYAIAKYMMLRDVGISADDMRIVVLQDLKLRVDHAVLAVYVSGTPYILDNRSSNVVPASSIHNYKPVYSINEHGWWLHRRTLDSSALGRRSEKYLITTKMLAAPVIDGSVGSTFAAQLASLPTNADAIHVAAEIRARYSVALAGRNLATLRVDLGAKGIWYRVLAGPFGSRQAARDLCAQIRAASLPADCIVISM